MRVVKDSSESEGEIETLVETKVIVSGRTTTLRVVKGSSKSERDVHVETMVQVAGSDRIPSLSSKKVTAVFQRYICLYCWVYMTKSWHFHIKM